MKRCDGAVNLVQGLLGAVYFFHPLVWWANRRIRQLREDACDERTVAALGGRRKPYGEAIFKVAEILGYAAPPLALGVLDSKAPLKQRLTRILDPGLPAARTLGWRPALAVIAAGAILIPSGARRVSTAQPPLAIREFANAANEAGPRPQDREVGSAARAAESLERSSFRQAGNGLGLAGRPRPPARRVGLR